MFLPKKFDHFSRVGLTPKWNNIGHSGRIIKLSKFIYSGKKYCFSKDEKGTIMVIPGENFIARMAQKWVIFPQIFDTRPE